LFFRSAFPRSGLVIRGGKKFIAAMRGNPFQRRSFAQDHFLKNRKIKKKQVLAITINGPIGRFVNWNTTMP
jgi:hypothetical protein